MNRGRGRQAASPVDQHLSRLGRWLWLVPWRRRRLLREARDHLLEATEQAAVGADAPWQAEQLAVTRFGDASGVLKQELKLAGPVWIAVLGTMAALTIVVITILGQQARAALGSDSAHYYVFPEIGQTFPIVRGADGRAVQVLKLAATSPSDMWSAGIPGNTLRHFDGRVWKAAPILQPRGRALHTQIMALTTSGNGEAWVSVGILGNRLLRTVFQRWTNGRWNLVSQPVRDASIYSMSASSPTSIWAVGYVSDPQDRRRFTPLVEHWNGTAWKPVAIPWERSARTLSNVIATPDGAVWVIGHDRRDHALIETWDGTSWARIPNPFNLWSTPTIAATSADNAWATGTYMRAHHHQPIVSHWDGRRWTRTPVPTRNTDSDVTGIVAISPSQAWALATSYHFHPSKKQSRVRPSWEPVNGWSRPATQRLFYLHWNGRGWSFASPHTWGHELSGTLTMTPTRTPLILLTCLAATPSPTYVLDPVRPNATPGARCGLSHRPPS